MLVAKLCAYNKGIGKTREMDPNRQSEKRRLRLAMLAS